MANKPNRCHCGGLRHKHDIERIAELEKERDTAQAANHYNALHRDKLVVENQRLREAAQTAVEYMRLSSPHPSQAMDELEALLGGGE